jgi:hypothetical protein
MAAHDDAAFAQRCPSHRACDPQLKTLRGQAAGLGVTCNVLLFSGAAITVGGIVLRLMVDTSSADEQRGVALGAVAALHY